MTSFVQSFLLRSQNETANPALSFNLHSIAFKFFPSSLISYCLERHLHPSSSLLAFDTLRQGKSCDKLREFVFGHADRPVLSWWLERWREDWRLRRKRQDFMPSQNELLIANFALWSSSDGLSPPQLVIQGNKLAGFAALRLLNLLFIATNQPAGCSPLQAFV